VPNQIPFSKFYLTHKGFVLENQRDLPKANVESIGISVMKQDGPFRLEIASISATNPVGKSDEELEYEMLENYLEGNLTKVEELEQNRSRDRFP
jgi:hypothetical protein